MTITWTHNSGTGDDDFYLIMADGVLVAKCWSTDDLEIIISAYEKVK